MKEALLWCIGFACGWFVAWHNYKRVYLLIDKNKLKGSNLSAKGQASGPPEGRAMATQRPTRCACCKETRRNEADTGFICICGWSAEDLLLRVDGEDYTCSRHRTIQRGARALCRHRPVTTSAGPFCELCGEEL